MENNDLSSMLGCMCVATMTADRAGSSICCHLLALMNSKAIDVQRQSMFSVSKQLTFSIHTDGRTRNRSDSVFS